MEYEKIIEMIVFVHAALGGLAMLAGGVALVAKKGKTVHKRTGKIFYYAMLASALIALVVSTLPNHESPFLFSIGIFSAYFLLSGLRSLNFRKTEVDLKVDKIIACLVVLTGSIMILYPVVINGKPNIVLAVFGMIGLAFGIRDLKLFRYKGELRKRWLKLHLSKMTGGYIAAITAFFVVNEILSGVWDWFVPGIIGSGYITYWMVKLSRTS